MGPNGRAQPYIIQMQERLLVICGSRPVPNVEHYMGLFSFYSICGRFFLSKRNLALQQALKKERVIGKVYKQ